jgi:hypothetical protein
VLAEEFLASSTLTFGNSSGLILETLETFHLALYEASQFLSLRVGRIWITWHTRIWAGRVDYGFLRLGRCRLFSNRKVRNQGSSPDAREPGR